MKDKSELQNWLELYNIARIALGTIGVKGVLITLDANGELEANVVLEK